MCAIFCFSCFVWFVVEGEGEREGEGQGRAVVSLSAFSATLSTFGTCSTCRFLWLRRWGVAVGGFNVINVVGDAASAL